MPIPAVSYQRVSTERQASDERSSLRDQAAAARALAARLGAELVRTFEDAGASGATVEGRPAFLELLAWCAENRRPARAPGYVLVLNASRLGRFDDPEEAAYYRVHLRRLGWIVRFAEGDAEGDAAPIVRAVESVQATAYRRALIANTVRGKRGGALQGFWVAGRAPFGYRREVVIPASAARVLEGGQSKAPNEKVRLIPHDEEARVVRWIFQTYADGQQTLGTLADSLLRMIPGRRWSRTVVNHLLRNAAYRGAVVGGRRRGAQTELYVCEDAHPALVEPRLWQAVQARLARNAKAGPATRSPYLLGGLLRCAICGGAYHGGTSRSHGQTVRMYRDSGSRHFGGSCPGRLGTVSRHLVDDVVLDLVGQTLRTPSTRRRIERAIDAALAGLPGQLGAAEAELVAGRARAEQRKRRLTSAIADGTLLPEEALPDLEAARRAVEDADQRLQALRFARGRTQGLQDERERLMAAAVDLPARAAAADPVRLRRLLEPWLGRATFHKETRVLALGIHEVPSFGLLSQPAPASQNEERLIVRRVALIQASPGQRVVVRKVARG